MGFSLRKFADRWAHTSIVACLACTVVCSLVLFTGAGGERAVEIVGAFGTIPLLIAVQLMLWPVITDPSLTARRRLAYRVLFAANTLDFVASVGWSLIALAGQETFSTWPDALYLLYYPMLAAALGLLYLDLGGRVANARSLIDIATLAIGFGTLLWFTALEPIQNMTAAQFGENWAVAGYGIGNAIALIGGGMLAMQITDWRSERPLVWLLTALVVSLVADLLWVNAELR